jgi:uncharacterized protein
MEFNREIIEKILVRQMPFGKYQGTKIIDLPVSYLEWFARNGFPQGTIGQELALVYEIKINGLTDLLKPLKGK